MFLQRSGWGFFADFLKYPETPFEKFVGGSIWVLVILAVYGVIPALGSFLIGNWLGLEFHVGGIIGWLGIFFAIWFPSIGIAMLMMMNMGEEMPPNNDID